MMQQEPNQQPAETQSQETSKPIKTVRSGPIGISIWQEKSAEGKDYVAFTLSRSWASKDGGKSGYSHKFFSGNRADLVNAINQACDAIERIEK